MKKHLMLLPLFCLSFLSGCNNKTNEIKKEIESSLVNENVDKVIVEQKTNKDTTIYVVYVYSHYKSYMRDSGYHYSIDMYIYDNGSLEWVYSI